jgi:hypothetical protein
LNLDGAQILSNTEKSINGGGRIAMICAPELPVCEEADYDCERRQEEYNVFCVNGYQIFLGSFGAFKYVEVLLYVLLFINVFYFIKF